MGDPARVYRLADAFGGYLTRHEPNATARVCGAWPGSLACAYLSRATRPRDWALLWRLVDARGVPDGDNATVVVHLRLGDVLDWPHYRGARGCARASGCYYVRPLAFYERVSLPRGVARADVVGDPTYRARYGTAHSVAYREAVAARLRARGLVVLPLQHGSADEDLLRVCAARHLVPGLGGFAALAAACARRRGAAVLA